MKLEDIKLQIGDKITFKNGDIDFVSLDFSEICDWKKSIILKIERYVCHSGMCQYEDDNEVTTLTHRTNIFYTLETIWERKEILDKEEKEYLSNVIRPKSIRNRIETISKTEIGDGRERIEFYYDKKDCCRKFIGLFSFKANTMYKGMELNKEYSLEELGL